MATIRDAASKMCKIADIHTAFNRLEEYYHNGIPKGHSTGWLGFNQYFKLLKGQLNVLSGVPSSGKSEWLESMAINLAQNEDWKIAVYSPENYPLEFYMIKLTEKLAGMPFFKRGNNEKMEINALRAARDFLETHFEFIDSGERAYSLDELLYTIEAPWRFGQGQQPDMVIIDPWNELEVTRGTMSETDYIGHSLTKCRRFARKYAISFWIVAHPTKIQRLKTTGEFPEMDLYDINGSAHWKNKVDNGIILHRNYKDLITNCIVKAKVAKIKNRFYGTPGEHFFKFHPENSTYRDFYPNRNAI